MNQHESAITFNYPVRSIAEAWREHAQRLGITDPETEILTLEAVRGRSRAGYRPAFFVPSTGELVVIIAAEPHLTQQQAKEWLRWILKQLHNNGNITLYVAPDDGEEVA